MHTRPSTRSYYYFRICSSYRAPAIDSASRKPRFSLFFLAAAFSFFIDASDDIPKRAPGIESDVNAGWLFYPVTELIADIIALPLERRSAL